MSLIMCISKILTDPRVIKQKIKIKNILANVVYSVLIVKKFLIKHKENSLIINGKQSVKVKIGSISFKNYFKQLSVPFKIYTDFECILKRVIEIGVVIEIMAHTQKNIKITFLAVLFTKSCVLIINLVKKLFFTEEKNAVYKFIKAILEESDYCKKMMKKYFNKNVIMSAEK